MGKYLKKFGSHSDYISFVGGEGDSQFLAPNVSYCTEENEVHYTNYDVRFLVKYKVTDASNPTAIFSLDGNSVPLSLMVIDGVETDPSSIELVDGYGHIPSGVYQFSEGMHEILYQIVMPTKEDDTYLFFDGNQVTTIDEVDLLTNSLNYNGQDMAFGMLTLFDTTMRKLVVNCKDVSIIGQMHTQLTKFEIEELVFTSNVKNIESGTFSGCSSITSVTINNPSITIGDNAFCACESINSADRAAIEAINPNAFCETYCIMATFDDSIEKADLGIGIALSYAFDNGTQIPSSDIIREERR